jgi:hypothetical protein
MKIPDVSQLSALNQRPSETSPRQDPSGFQKVFDNILDQATTGKSAPSVGIHSSTPPPLTINTIEPLPPVSGVQAMERFIDSLEDYQKGLENPQCNLRDLEPAIERLEREHRRLSHLANDSSDDNPLKRIMSEGLVTATLEIGRFRSGVYC